MCGITIGRATGTVSVYLTYLGSLRDFCAWRWPGRLITFAERVAHEVWIEEAGNRDGLGGGWATKKLWKPLKIADNRDYGKHGENLVDIGCYNDVRFKHDTVNVLSSIYVFFESNTHHIDRNLARQQHRVSSDMF